MTVFAESETLLSRILNPVIVFIGNGPFDFLVSALGESGFDCRTLPQRSYDTLPFNEVLTSTTILTYRVRCEEGKEMPLLHQIRRNVRNNPIIVVTSEDSEKLASACREAHVNDYLKSPLTSTMLVESVSRFLPKPFVTRQPTPKLSPTQLLVDSETLVGQSYHIVNIKRYIQKVARKDTTVLITGESGTGKEIVAQLIHKNSPRRSRPMVTVNCAAIPDSLLESEMFGHDRGAFTGATIDQKGQLEQANGSTIFLDEIGEIPFQMQAKLLRALENQEISRLGSHKRLPLDIRILAATNQDLFHKVQEGTFRKDLYYRLNIASIQLLPLRERRNDIPLLIEFFLRRYSDPNEHEPKTIDPELSACLTNYTWPGNVREVRNFCEASTLNSSSRMISFADVPVSFGTIHKKNIHFDSKEKDRILTTLDSMKWNISAAAQELSWSRMTMYRKLAKYQIYRPPASDLAGRRVVVEKTCHPVTS